MGDFIGKKFKLCFKRDSVTNKHPNKTFALEPISCISPECVNPGRWPPFVSVRQISSSFGCRFGYRRYFMIFLVDMSTILGTKWYKYTNSITGSDMQMLFFSSSNTGFQLYLSDPVHLKMASAPEGIAAWT